MRKVPVRSSVWFSYLDANGLGYAEADHIIFLRDRAVILECKLSQTENAALQIKQLYRPLLRKILGEGVLIQGVQVCKNLYRECPGLVGSLQEVLASNSEDIFTWHHLGRN